MGLEKRSQILLATYNGEKHLAEQLDSLLAQTDSDFEILVRDDGSFDGTQDILDQYISQFPEKIRQIKSGAHLGITGNFNALLEHSTSEHLFFCDQDDVWEKDKIETSLKYLLNTKSPLLFHSDLTVVNEKLDCLHPSFWKYAQINPWKGRELNRLLVQNCATGCTMAFNKALKDLIYPIPKEAILHDWWTALIAAALGQIVISENSTIRYRQHSQNAVGASHLNWKDKLSKFFAFIQNPHFSDREADKLENQAKALLSRVGENDDGVLKAFLSGRALSPMMRKWVYLRYRFFRQGLKRIFPYLLQNRPF